MAKASSKPARISLIAVESNPTVWAHRSAKERRPWRRGGASSISVEASGGKFPRTQRVLIVGYGGRDNLVGFEDTLLRGKARNGPTPKEAPRLAGNRSHESFRVGRDYFKVFQNIFDIEDGLGDGRFVFGEEGIDPIDQGFARGEYLIQVGGVFGVNNCAWRQRGVTTGPGSKLRYFSAKTVSELLRPPCRTEWWQGMTDFGHDTN